MVTLRCTRKLLKRLRVRPSGHTPAPSSPLGDWYATLLSVGHTRLIMCVSEVSLLPAFVRSQSGVGLTARFQEAVVAVLAKLGIAKARVATEKQHLAEVI